MSEVANDQDAGQKGSDEGSGAQTDESLDKILDDIDQEFEKGTKTSSQQSSTENEEVRQLKETVSSLEQKAIQADIDQAATTISESLELSVKPSSKVIKGLLNEEAAQDPRISRAFQNRHRDPTTWSKVLKGVAKNIEKEFQPGEDRDLTEGREALTTALQGKSQTAKSEDDDQKFMDRFFRTASDAQLNEYKRTLKVPENFK